MIVTEPQPAIVAHFKDAKKLAIAVVRLLDNASIAVDGFGIPFANPEDPEVEGWVNGNTEVLLGLTILDFLRRREFHFIVPMKAVDLEKEWSFRYTAPPFSYPYGTEHDWPVGEHRQPDTSHYDELLEQTKSAEQFRPAFK
jgi:hypothetical protein